ncbi:S-layer protein [Alloalcanivorax xenomutans]|uniref:S-layer protein n=1 Tax=Alloalcanivorax xenomutans TaxID=1094342 RepID=UPI003D9B890C
MSFLFSRDSRVSLLSAITLATFLSACGGSGDSSSPSPEPTPEPTPEPQPSGTWSAGDLHVHTYQSDDAQVSLESVLDDAFTRYDLDWLTISNHLRTSYRDHDGAELGESIPFYQALIDYEVPYLKQALDQDRYPGALMYSSFEWDMPTHDHVNVGIGVDDPMSEANLQAVAEFEYLFTTRDASLFDPALVESLGDQPRANTTHEDALTALRWLRDNHPDSYMLLNHPSRYMGKYTIAQIRQMHDLAPDQFFAIEGMVGNQMEPDRGGYAEAYTEENLGSRTYGGVDYLVAKLGGTWDALLGEGRRIWNVANSDYHFTTAQGRYSSGYAPGEYAKTYVWKDGEDASALLDGLRGGRLFGVFGDLIDALEFQAESTEGSTPMGGTLTAALGEQVTVTIRFRSPQTNHYEYPLESGQSAYMKPTVDHVDLIVGDVQAPAQPDSADYRSASNPSTRVLARFTANDWTVDEDGYNVITHTLTVTGDQYLRLRGTNLAVNVPGQMEDGEPLPDTKVEVANDAARFDAINARNYNDLWFYSNPVFITVE